MLLLIAVALLVDVFYSFVIYFTILLRSIWSFFPGGHHHNCTEHYSSHLTTVILCIPSLHDCLWFIITLSLLYRTYHYLTLLYHPFFALLFTVFLCFAFHCLNLLYYPLKLSNHTINDIKEMLHTMK